ncbi:MarR family winged helix-turn-helix transcriptional regulator [Amphiplicatus metriothermophilus]|uniref:DNA-binding transcriptional regulator, MarR family n=1 Tax=Amphiplicatus metriothermophilus TaxID=1519374 RepID=A0A239PJ81_9PROT|nr:MarR family transcriptional regulator [Amphiplicatus metriothermophilus]MBB5517838.1 DNA-binding MarR family transcriptional regulator [Amphiplicatus metriothermophilus]SNT67828.1 DNA-binding transcriptional regulator, MarR family [Amphiplicatus metriothermophilus]
MTKDKAEQALVALRRILRATEINARALARRAGLTPSQLIILQVISRAENVTLGAIAREVSLTQATVTALVDRLERAGFARRRRDHEDRRRVLVKLTEAGRAALAAASDSLQERFETRFAALADWEQSMLIAALERVALLLNAEDLDAAPVLDYGAIDK